MDTGGSYIAQFIEEFYGNKVYHFKDDINAIIFYLHYVDTETISKAEIQNACMILRELSKL